MTALKSFPCFFAYRNELVDAATEMKYHDLPRAKSATICLLMTCSM
jgi:hypothetical protein